jgi:N,N'-diacetyllegionaminate synthase
MKVRKTLVIAEAGVNHNGELTEALNLVTAASEAGADIVKFQTFVADRLVIPEAPKADYQKKFTGTKETQINMLHKLELSRDDHLELLNRCKDLNIGFLSTGFDIKSVDMLVSLGVRLLKVPSGEITNLPYLRHVGSLGLPVILSTGMADLDEVQLALEVLFIAGLPRTNVTVLHCTTAYPAPKSDVNLLAMRTIRESLGVKVGYSDHTQGCEIAVAAVALGACVVEKHLTLNNSAPGPDHAASLEPSDFAEMVSAIRSIDIALGNGIKACQPSEFANKGVARKSIVAAVQIKSGELFTESNITVKRPGFGLSPMLWDQILGTRALRDFLPNELIEI